MTEKSENAYKSIGEVAKILNLINKKTGKLNTHTIRLWEKEFKQIKPKFFNGNRRYYDTNSVNILIKIKKLLKVDGMTINGVKKHLQKANSFKLDENEFDTIKVSKNNIKNKVEKISTLIKEIKKLG